MNFAAVVVAGVFAVPCGVSEGKCIASSVLMALIILSTKRMTASGPSGASISTSKSLSPNGVVYAPLVDSLEIASRFRCFMPVRRTTMKLKSEVELALVQVGRNHPIKS